MQQGSMQLQALVERIAELDIIEHDEIAKLIASSDVPFTTNSNGVFVDMASVPADVITQIETFVNFCAENRKMLTDDRRFVPYLNSTKQEGAGAHDGSPVRVDTERILDKAKTCLVEHNIYNMLFPDRSAVVKRKPQVKRTFVQNARRGDLYNAEFNELDSDEHVAW